MKPRRTAGILALGLAAAGFNACSPSLPLSPDRTPVRWIVVEKRANEVTEDGSVGDGRMDPQAVVLTMQPLYREDLEWEVVVEPHDYFVELLEISPGPQAEPGETVTARVRVGRARPNGLYRLTARASQAGVEILGEHECIVRGSSPASFQFTSLGSGRAGIAVELEMIDGNRR